MAIDANKVHHVVSGGLVHNKYYRVYVTQVNKSGNESERSEPALIRVGDVYAPPTPHVELDTAMYPNGCFAQGDFVSVMFKWNDISRECDDLDHYNWFKFSKWVNFKGNGIYTEKEIRDLIDKHQIVYEEGGTLTSGTTHATLGGCIPGQWAWAGLQAVDISRNASDVYIFGGAPQDLNEPPKPPDAPNVEPNGIWALRVWIDCPSFYEVDYVVFYRDGWMQLPPVVFHPGLTAEYVDTLDVMSGLTHFYTYRFITKDGRESIMSAESSKVTAQAIDTSVIDKKVLEDLKKAWNSDIVNSTDALKKAAEEQSQKSKELADKLKDVTESYNQLFDKYQVAAKEIELLSGRVDEQDEEMSTMQTSIKQNAEAITLRATKEDIDKKTNELNNAFVAQINVQGDRITQIVSDMTAVHSNISQLSNQIQLKVDKNNLKSEINLAIQNGISVATLTADRIVLNGQLLLQGNARVHGKLYSNDIALVDEKTNRVVWGAGQGTINPVTDSGKIWTNEFHCIGRADGHGWQEFYSVQYTPKPKLNFNGIALVTGECKLFVGVSAGDYDRDGEHIRAMIRNTLNGLDVGAVTTCNQWDESGAVRVGDYGTTEWWNFYPRNNGRGYRWIGGSNHVAIHWKEITIRTTAQCPIGVPLYFKFYNRAPSINGGGYNDGSPCIWAGMMEWKITVQ